MIRSYPPHPNPLPPGEREAIHPPNRTGSILGHFDKITKNEPHHSSGRGLVWLSLFLTNHFSIIILSLIKFINFMFLWVDNGLNG
jgi:hypothetical protein